MNISKKKSIGKKAQGMAILIVLLCMASIVGIGAGGSYVYDKYWGEDQPATQYSFSQTGTTSGSGLASFAHNCGDTPTTSFTMSIHNPMNTTGDETFDVSGVCTSEQSGAPVAFTETTAPTASTSYACGNTYICKFASSTGAAGDTGVITKVRNGPAEILDNGRSVRIKITEKVTSVDLESPQGGVLEFRQKDAINDDFAGDSTDQTTTDYETDGVAFNSSTANTAMSISTGGYYKWTTYMKVNSLNDAVWGSMGYYILVDAESNATDVPTVKVNGIQLGNVKDMLNADEKIAYSNYEYVYFVDVASGAFKSVTNTNEHTVEVYMPALAGVDPVNDIETDFAAIGGYASTGNSNSIKYGAVTDASTHGQVFALEDVTQNIA
jgi:hypothetical protein